MSTVQEDMQKAREALSGLGPRLGDRQKARGAIAEILQSLELAMPAPEPARARPPSIQEGRPGREGAKASRLALEHVERALSLMDSTELLVRVSKITRALTVPHGELALFVGLLRHCGILPKEQEYSLEEGGTLQKCAFIARAFGLDMGYEWYLNEYGTYSPFLDADHVELVDGGLQVDFGVFVGLDEVPGYGELMERIKDDAPVQETQFDAGGFISLVSGKGLKWLSVASTIVHERGSCPDDELPARVARISADCDEKTARRVMEDIASGRPPAWGVPAGGGEE